MQSGDLTHRFLFEVSVRVGNSMLGFTESWQTVIPVTYGALWPIKGTETLEGGRKTAIATHRLRIRFRKPFSAQWRVRDLFNGTYYSIVGAPIDVKDKHRYLEMMVKETQP